MCRRLVYLISLVLVLDLVGGNPANGADIDIRYLDEPGPVLWTIYGRFRQSS